MKISCHLAFAIACGLLCFTSLVVGLPAQEKSAPTRPFEVFVYPKKLTFDKLTEAGSGKEVGLHDDTILIWVDLNPDARYSHPTEFILISAEGTRVVKGNWWPKLNGKDLFRDGKQFKVDFPLAAHENFRTPKDPRDLRSAHVFVHPNKLTPQDKLSDGKKAIDIKSDTFLVWVNMAPHDTYARPPEYVLISAAGARVLKGESWPILNGKDLFRDKGSEVSFPLLSNVQPK